VDALEVEEAIAKYGCPEIFNTDQGIQFTAEAFTDTLHSRGIAISMNGKGRWMDNVFIERLWKSVKYEDIYLKAYGSMAEAKKGLTPISCSTTKNDGTKTSTGRPRLWFTSTLYRRTQTTCGLLYTPLLVTIKVPPKHPIAHP
jgi:transposase InsO family protein